MSITIKPIQFRHNMRRLAQIVGLATVALLAGVAIRGYLDLQDVARDRLVEVSASYRAYTDVASLTRNADVVVLGRVVGEGTTHQVKQPVNAPRVFQPQQTDTSGLPDKKDGVGNQTMSTGGAQPQSSAVAQPQSSSSRSAQFDIPVTLFTIDVERVVRGNARMGQITVSQPGGKMSTPTFPGGPQIERTVQFEHDPLMKSGDRQLLFLRDAHDGTYSVVGGPQGRATVDRTDKVHPIDGATPAVRGREGQSVEGLIAEVASVR